MNIINDEQVFLQDIASIDRTDVNDEYLENMAVLLQSLDVDGDAYNGIVITKSMHDAFSDESFDLATISEQDLITIIESTGRESVSEDNAMEHVQDMLVEYTDLEHSEFDVRVDDEAQLNESENLILVGSDEDDILVAGLGSDTLTGGDGADTFIFEAADSGENLILDYNKDEGDVIVLNELLVDDSDSLDAHLSVIDDGNGNVKIEIKDNPEDANPSSSITLDNPIKIS
ncbi:MAG: type I secretion C-terminal target domain-containing protein [gamma proteobacterium symbiont of Lucinoma myriamae]|nr:type I secretion C-terminal target domain-containing protein [gamma proteobacterium symbiont of Lucinoma myriamae]